MLIKRRYLSVLLLLLLVCPALRGESFTIEFKQNTSDATSVLSSSTFRTQITAGTEYYDTIAGMTAVFEGRRGLLLGRNNSKGKFTLHLNDAYKITQVTIKAYPYGTDDCKMVCGVSSESYSVCNNILYATGTDCSWSFQGSEMSTIYVATSGKRAYISSITVDYIDLSTIPLLNKPTNMASTLNAPTTVTLRWEAVEHADRYMVTYTSAQGESKEVEVTENCCTLTGLLEGSGYRWSVRAIGDGIAYNDSEESEETAFTTGILPTYTVRWVVNREIVVEEAVKEGSSVSALPPTPSDDALGSCADRFRGWSASDLGAYNGQSAPQDLFTGQRDIVVTSDTTFYAVFATQQPTKRYVLLTSAPDDWSGRYLIGYYSSTLQIVMATHFGNPNTNTYGTSADLSEYYDESTHSFSEKNASAYQYTFAKTANGYSICYDKEGSYLGVNTEANMTYGNYLRWNTAYSDLVCEWTLTYEDGHPYIRSVKRDGFYILCVPNSKAENQFKTYYKLARGALSLYRLEYDYADYKTACEVAGEEILVTDWDKTSMTVRVGTDCDAVYAVIPTQNDGIASRRETEGQRTAEGVYRIVLPKMDSLACTDISIEARRSGQVVASKVLRVPIVVTTSTTTSSTDLFMTERRTEEQCRECDIVVRDRATLTHSSGGRNAFRDVYIAAGSSLNIGSGFSLNTLILCAKNDSVSFAITGNGSNSTISINRIVHVKEIDGHYWYDFSLPYECSISDIRELSGVALGTYGVDWGIKYYDGEQCQRQGVSAVAGEAGLHWKMLSASDTLRANTGYIIGLFYSDEDLTRSVYFTPTQTNNYSEDLANKVTTIRNWSDNLGAPMRHHGWNFVGSPYISLFGESASQQGLNHSNLKMGYTHTSTGEQMDKDNIYISIPDGAGRNTYTQRLASAETIYPFRGYFVQAIDPTDGVGHTLYLIYNKNYQSLPAGICSSTVAADSVVRAEIVLTAPDSQCDYTGLVVGNRYSTDYEIGDDLAKFYAADTKPQLYTLDNMGEMYAYQAIPYTEAQSIPLGLYVPKAGEYRLRLNDKGSDVSAAQAIYLLYRGAIVADLLYEEYAIRAVGAGSVAGYTIDVRRREDVSSNLYGSGRLRAYMQDGALFVEGTDEGERIYVYDVLGRLIRQGTTSDRVTIVPLAQRGVYTIQIGREVFKVIRKQGL